MANSFLGVYPWGTPHNPRCFLVGGHPHNPLGDTHCYHGWGTPPYPPGGYTLLSWLGDTPITPWGIHIVIMVGGRPHIPLGQQYSIKMCDVYIATLPFRGLKGAEPLGVPPIIFHFLS